MSDTATKKRLFSTEFDESIVRHAIGSIVVESFRSALRYVVILAILGGGGLVLLKMLTAAPNALLLYLLTGVLAASVFWAIIVLLNYLVTLRDSLRLFRAMTNLTVEFQIDSQGISVTSAAWSGTIPWSRTLRLIRHRALLLIGLGGTQVARNGPDKIRLLSVLGEEMHSEESLLKLWRLPIMWARPSMSQLFLVVPIAALQEDAVDLITGSIGGNC